MKTNLIILAIAVLGIFFAGFFCHMAIMPHKIIRQAVEVPVHTDAGVSYSWLRDSLPMLIGKIKWPVIIIHGVDTSTIDSATAIGSLPQKEFVDSFALGFKVNDRGYLLPADMFIGYQGLLNYVYVKQRDDSFTVVYDPGTGAQTPQGNRPNRSSFTGGLILGADLDFTDVVRGKKYMPNAYPDGGAWCHYRHLFMIGRAGVKPITNDVDTILTFKLQARFNLGVYYNF